MTKLTGSRLFHSDVLSSWPEELYPILIKPSKTLLWWWGTCCWSNLTLCSRAVAEFKPRQQIPAPRPSGIRTHSLPPVQHNQHEPCWTTGLVQSNVDLHSPWTSKQPVLWRKKNNDVIKYGCVSVTVFVLKTAKWNTTLNKCCVETMVSWGAKLEGRRVVQEERFC